MFAARAPRRIARLKLIAIPDDKGSEAMTPRGVTSSRRYFSGLEVLVSNEIFSLSLAGFSAQAIEEVGQSFASAFRFLFTRILLMRMFFVGQRASEHLSVGRHPAPVVSDHSRL